MRTKVCVRRRDHLGEDYGQIVVWRLPMGMVLIKNGKLLGKRGLRLASLDDVLEQADMLMERGYTKSGEWTLGQVCQHLSYGIIFSIDGHPFAVSKVMTFVSQTI